MSGKFKISKRSNGQFQFNLNASNGQTILTSQGYAAKASCQAGIESVRKNSQDSTRFEKKVASNGKHYFTLVSSNGQAVGSSQMYADTSGRDNGIASVAKNAVDAKVDDETA